MSIESASMITEKPAKGGPGLADQLGLPPDILAPIIEGARARGMADAFEMTGQAVVLLDRAGAVLHITSHAARLMGQGLSIAGGHLIGADAQANQRLGNLIGAALADCDDRGHTAVPVDAFGNRLRITARSVGGARQSPFQLLKALVILESLPDAV